MTTIHVTDREGDTFALIAEPGLSLMETIRDSGRGDIQALCGGTKACATCHVIVAPAWFDRLATMDEDENDLLDGAAERQPTSRLSCQIAIEPDLDGLSVTIAPEY